MTISAENKRFLRHLLYLAPPIIMQEVINTAVNMLDTIMIGVKLGVNEVAAVGLGNQIFFLFALILFGVNSGSSIFVGQFWGKEDVKSIHKTMGIGFVFNMIIAGIFFILAFFFSDILMGFYSQDPVVIDLGSRYLRIVCFCYFFVSITFTRNAALRSIGQTKIPMMTTFVALMVNLIMNYYFLFIGGWSVEGVAVATVLSRMLELLAQQIILHKLHLPIVGRIKDFFTFDFQFTKKFFNITAFVILNEFLWALGTSIYNKAYGYCGTEAQGAVQICSTMMQLFQVLGMAIGTACGIMLANFLGSGERDLAIRYAKKCIKMSAVVSIFMAIFLIITAPAIISIYKVEDIVIEYAYKITYAMAFAMIFKTVNYTTIVGILRSGGDTKYCFKLDALSVWLVGVPLAFLGALVLKVPVYWVVFMAYGEEYSKFIFAIRRTLSNVWANTIV